MARYRAIGLRSRLIEGSRIVFCLLCRPNRANPLKYLFRDSPVWPNRRPLGGGSPEPDLYTGPGRGPVSGRRRRLGPGLHQLTGGSRGLPVAAAAGAVPSRAGGMRSAGRARCRSVRPGRRRRSVPTARLRARHAAAFPQIAARAVETWAAGGRCCLSSAVSPRRAHATRLAATPPPRRSRVSKWAASRSRGRTA